MTAIENAKSAIWDSNTLNVILRQLRTIKGMEVKRNSSAGTVVVTGTTKSGKKREFVRGLELSKGRWSMRFDKRLIEPK